MNFETLNMTKFVVFFTVIILFRLSTAAKPAVALVGGNANVADRPPGDERRQLNEAALTEDDAPGRLVVLEGGRPRAERELVADDDDGDADADGRVLLGRARVVSVERAPAAPAVPVLEPLMLPPVLDVYPEVPDRVGDRPLQVETVIEAEPTGDEQQLDVPWVWDDKVCSPLLNRPPPPAGPLTSAQVTFSLPLVVRDGKRLKLKTRAGAESPLHSDEAAATFEKLFWCVTALIARVREPEERTRLMKKLYQDYLLWMEEDVIPVFNRTDLKRAYKWIKKKDDSQWVVPEKKIYDSAGRRSVPRAAARTSEDKDSGRSGDKSALIIAILIFIVIIVIILYCCLVRHKKIFNFWCFCVCERCKKRLGGRGHEEERKPLTVRKGQPPGGPDGPKKTYVYRSSSWSSNSSLQPPCGPAPDPGSAQRQQAPCP